ncbi:MAG: hypothetical protein U5M23_03435 [Marinagarivorans sp.]|nr:hypothetical protein [Marinagarivorans sp.]
MSEYQEYYKPILDEIIQTVYEDWDFAIGEYGVGIKSCDSRFSYIKNNMTKSSKGVALSESQQKIARINRPERPDLPRIRSAIVGADYAR